MNNITPPTAKRTLCAIVAMSRNHVIGNGLDMPWHIPVDLKYYKRITMGKPLVMGRKCFDSLGGRPLPGRPHVVVSRTLSPDNLPGSVEVVHSLEEGIARGYEIAKESDVDEVFINGGGEIYKATLAQTARLYLTLIDQNYEGDVFFPQFDWNEWTIKSEDRVESPDHPPLTFYVLER